MYIMKNSKYIKVSVKDRHPEKEGDYYVKMRHLSDLQLYYYLDPLHDREYMNKNVEYWIEEKPDYEDEMKEMLERVINAFETDYVVDGEIVDKPYEWLQDVYKETKSLLTKLKTES